MNKKVPNKIEVRKQSLADFLLTNVVNIEQVKGWGCTYKYKGLIYQLLTRSECKWQHGHAPDEISKEEFDSYYVGICYSKFGSYYIAIVEIEGNQMRIGRSINE